MAMEVATAAVLPCKTFTLTHEGKPVSPPNYSKYNETSTLAVVNGTKIVRQQKGELMFTSENSTPGVVYKNSLYNTLVGTIFEAYSHHHKLELRPDDLWLSIAITFADYVDNHAEEMRSQFVSHEGKKQLIVNAASISDIQDITQKFSDLINQNTNPGVNGGPSVRDWIEPRFSTSTKNDSLIARVALMGALKNYFAYGCCIECGIPEVTLLGTLQDWQALRAKVNHIGNFGQEQLVWWRDLLLPIVDKFIASYQGNVDNNFWQSCACYHPGGSGPSHISGWVLAFSPFQEGKWRLEHPKDIAALGKYGMIETGDFVSATTVEVPVKVNDNGNEYDTYFYAYGNVSRYESGTNTMRPSYDFAMFKMPKGTIKDKLDFNDPSVKPVGRHHKSPKPVVSKLDMMVGRPETLTVPHHKHPLLLKVLPHNRCDHCYAYDIGVGYNCEGCNYDNCLKCVDSLKQ